MTAPDKQDTCINEDIFLLSDNTEINACDGRRRAVIECITPSVDGGRFAAKRIVGDEVVVEADCFSDGHDLLACLLLWQREDEADVPWWNGAQLIFQANLC